MPLRIEDPEVEELANALAAQTGESIAVAVKRALEERLARIVPPSSDAALLDELANIRKLWASLPVRDSRSADQILDYDEGGLPR